jgi:hypothetical protein
VGKILFFILVPFFLLVGTFHSQNSFDKQQVAACGFSKEFYANLKDVSNNKKKKLHSAI